MVGYHEVRRFTLAKTSRDISLPPGWKPFAAFNENGRTVLICRKWTKID